MEKKDYVEMAKYFGTSEKSLKRWEKEKPAKFDFMKEEFMEQLNRTQEENINSKIIIVMSHKGGVGKSTVSDAFAAYLGDSVVFNLDISQPSKHVNSTDTVDYIELMDKISIMDILKKLSTQYKYIIVDTPGEIMPEVQEIIKISSSLGLGSNIIMPMTIGKRSRVDTINTLEAYFENGSDLQGKFNIYFLFNIVVNKKKRKVSAENFLNAFNNFKADKNVEIIPKLGSFDYSDAIVTAEEEGKSIFTLATENRAAYSSVLGKISGLCSNIEEHFQLQ